MRALVLFTRDLRIQDHPALAEACRVADEVVPLFVLDRRLLAASANRARFLLESLVGLDRSLEGLGGRLVVREGSVAARTRELAVEWGCRVAFMTADASAHAQARERRLGAALRAAGVDLRVMPGHAVIEPGAVAPSGRRAYRVFTPYWRAWSGAPLRSMASPPARVRVPEGLDPGPALDPTSVRPEATELPAGGETAGRRRLEAFLRDGAGSYGDQRDDLAADATARLSPYLRFGCLSANEVVRRAREVPGADSFVRQLCWRDFFLQLLADRPETAWEDLRPGPRTEPPVPGDVALEAWSEGRTGLPLVDAGMRQLMREGWMHNRARMVAASFLTRRLGVSWQEGAARFFQLLVDGDPASNSGNWQWVAGTGTDPRRSRAFNPVRQARRYDPSGAYVRLHVPEFADVRDGRLFAPWTDPGLLRDTGYPEPVLPVPTA